MRFTERQILRRVAERAADYLHAAERRSSGRGRPDKVADDLRRWLTVLDAWDAEHTCGPERLPSVPLLEHKPEAVE